MERGRVRFLCGTEGTGVMENDRRGRGFLFGRRWCAWKGTGVKPAGLATYSLLWPWANDSSSEPQLPYLLNKDNSNVYHVVLHAYKGGMCKGLAQSKTLTKCLSFSMLLAADQKSGELRSEHSEEDTGVRRGKGHWDGHQVHWQARNWKGTQL